MTKAQFDLFASQGDFFPDMQTSYAPNPDRIRRKLAAVLGQLRSAGNMPWDSKTLRYHQTVFPQMASVLPDGEAAQYRLEFASELRRLAQG